jgi:hypothetical protein
MMLSVGNDPSRRLDDLSEIGSRIRWDSVLNQGDSRIELMPHGARTFQAMEVSKMGICASNFRGPFLMITTGGLLLVLNLSVACHQIKGLPDRHLRDLPDTRELVGTWKIDDDSRTRLRSSPDNLSRTSIDDHLLILRKDGTCLFKTYWDFQSDDNYATSEGTWEPTLRETVAGTGQQRAAVVVMLKPTGHEEIITTFWIVRENGQLVLWKYIGDPDYTRYEDFHRVQH